MGTLLMSILAAGMIGSFEDTVVSPQWLEQNLRNPNVIVVEIGSQPKAGAATVHTASWPRNRRFFIPGARFIAIESIVARKGWPPDELPPVEQLQKAFENAGVGDEGRIILYSANPLWATRAWFTLDALGHGYRAAILDGGFDRWIKEKRPLATKPFNIYTKTFTPKFDASRVTTLADVQLRLALNEAVLIDARPGEEFGGLRRGAAVTRGGHIPGAHCDPWKSTLKKDGSFLPASELQGKYAKLIPNREQRVIVYCRTGMEATMPYFVLRSLGYNVVLFDGSYTEWSRDGSVSVATVSAKP